MALQYHKWFFYKCLLFEEDKCLGSWGQPHANQHIFKLFFFGLGHFIKLMTQPVSHSTFGVWEFRPSTRAQSFAICQTTGPRFNPLESGKQAPIGKCGNPENNMMVFWHLRYQNSKFRTKGPKDFVNIFICRCTSISVPISQGNFWYSFYYFSSWYQYRFPLKMCFFIFLLSNACPSVCGGGEEGGGEPPPLIFW